MKKIAAMMITVSILVVGCVTTPLDYKTGIQVSQQQLEQFISGATTQSDVIQAIGQPNRKEPLNGKEIWYYDFNQVGVLGVNVSEATVFEWSAKGDLLQSYKTGKSGQTGNALLDAANQ